VKVSDEWHRSELACLHDFDCDWSILSEHGIKAAFTKKPREPLDGGEAGRKSIPDSKFYHSWKKIQCPEIGRYLGVVRFRDVRPIVPESSSGRAQISCVERELV